MSNPGCNPGKLGCPDVIGDGTVITISHAHSPDNAPLPVCPDGIPLALRSIPQWVAWASTPRGTKKPAKQPVNVRTGRPADVTNPAHLVGFDDALGFYRDRG